MFLFIDGPKKRESSASFAQNTSHFFSQLMLVFFSGLSLHDSGRHRSVWERHAARPSRIPLAWPHYFSYSLTCIYIYVLLQHLSGYILARINFQNFSPLYYELCHGPGAHTTLRLRNDDDWAEFNQSCDICNSIYLVAATCDDRLTPLMTFFHSLRME